MAVRFMLVRRPHFFLALAMLAASPAAFAAPVEPQAFDKPAVEQPRATLQELLAQDPMPQIGGRTVDAVQLRRLYDARGYAPIWADRNDRVTELAAATVAASDDGVDFPPVQAILDMKLAPAERDLLLSDAAMRLASALASGRVKPELFEDDWAIHPPAFDAAAGLDKALGGDRLTAWIGGLVPSDPRYLRLKQALAHYRDLVRQGGWPQIPPGGATIKVGDSDPRIPAIRQHLIIEGDLPADTAGDETFDPVLAQGMFAFQTRHGILGDSAIGARSIAALNVTARQRVEQIALNLERWHSMPRDFGKNYIFVNVPAALMEVFEDGAPVMKMRVVTGDPKHPTPVVQSRVQAVTFNPAWRIPASIIKNEIQPKLKKDPAYLTKNDMAYGPGGLQQNPGPKNALGRIKFETPNKFDVYLHDTPSRAAFARVARAESHGCVRLEDARGLANYVLRPPKWTPELIEAAVATGETQHTEPGRRLGVSILYFTTYVDADGTMEFRDDVYGRDKDLRQALDGTLPRTVTVIAKPRVQSNG